MAGEIERRLERLQHAPAEQLGVDRVLDADEHDAELVAADPRHGVDLAHAGAEPHRDLLEQEIARGMAEGVVDVLEAVEVEKQQGRHVAPAADAGDRLLEPLEQQNPVGQPGQRVVHARDTRPGDRPRSRR